MLKLLYIYFFAFSAAFAQSQLPAVPTPITFQGFKFGSTLKSVQKSSKHKLILRSPAQYSYKTVLHGYLCLVIFDFFEDSLAAGSIAPIDPDISNDESLAYFFDIKDFLVSKYGQPKDTIFYYPDSSLSHSTYTLTQRIMRGDVILSFIWVDSFGNDIAASVGMYKSEFLVTFNYSNLALCARKESFGLSSF